jgi:hypothetical protein
MHIHAIYAYTGTYMHVPITVRRGLWGAVADTVCLRECYNFPNRLGWGLGLGQQAQIRPGTPLSRARGAVQGPPTVAEGGCAKSGCQRPQGWSKTILAPMTWGALTALSEASRVPPLETVIRGHGCDYCVCRCSTSKYAINSYNTG